jgi:hypothetical protein
MNDLTLPLSESEQKATALKIHETADVNGGTRPPPPTTGLFCPPNAHDNAFLIRLYSTALIPEYIAYCNVCGWSFRGDSRESMNREATEHINDALMREQAGVNLPFVGSRRLYHKIYPFG